MYKILIVDDEDIVRDGLVNCIDWKNIGYEIIGSAEDGQQALDFLNKCAADILITDIKMPFMDGLELSEKVNELYPDTSIIILSGYDEFSYAKKAINCGASDYILKPISSKELRNIMLELKRKLDEKSLQKATIEEYKIQLTESIPLLKEKFLSGIIYGIHNETELNKQKKFLELFSGDTPYLVCLFDIYYSVDDDITIQDKEINISSLSEDINKNNFNNINKLAFPDKYDNVACVFFKAEKEDILSSCEDFRNYFYNKYNIIVTVGIGTMVDNIKDIHTSYKAAREALSNKLILGANKVIDINDINPSENKALINIPDIIQKIISNIKLNNKSELSKNIQNYCSIIKNSNMSISYAKLSISELVSVLLRLIYEYDIETAENMNIEVNNFYTKINQLSDMNDVQKWLERISLLISNNVNTLKNKRFSNIVNNVKDYIDTNYKDFNLNLKTTAKEFFISNCYLSTIFKKETGESFIEYLTNVRIEKAKELLKNTNLKLYEISNQTGFNDQYYFSLIFKKHVGVSPSVYKENLTLNPFTTTGENPYDNIKEN